MMLTLTDTEGVIVSRWYVLQDPDLTETQVAIAIEKIFDNPRVELSVELSLEVAY